MSDMLNSAAASYILAGGLTPDTTAEWQRLFDQVLQKNQELVQRCNEEIAKGSGDSAVVAAFLIEVGALLKKYPHLASELQFALPDNRPLRNALRRETETATKRAIASGQTITNALVDDVVARVMRRESKT